MNTPIKVLICRSNPIAPDPRVEKEAQSLLKAGYQTHLLGWDRTGALPVYEETAWGIIERLPIKAEYARGILNFFPLLRWQFGLLVWLLRHSDEFALLHACDFDTILPALFCARLKKKKLIYDIFDFYADHLRNTPGFVKALIRRVDLWAIGRADGLILVDESRIEQIAGAKPRRLAVIYNTPQDLWNAAQAQPGSAASSIRVAYVGLLQYERGLLELIEVMQRHPDWQLDLAGFGGDEAAIQQSAAANPNIRWHGRVPYSQALELSRQANVLVALYDPVIPNHRYASPNKIFEAMMLGKPVIVARGTNMDRIVEDAQCGLVVNYGAADELDDALARLERDAELREKLGRAARQAYEQHYSWAVMEARLTALYQQVISADE
ncbi:MAG: glycosyltransferase WbuB [Anaerolineae bacterium UTCFX2]|nr:glycosyltransferase family 4 protein [Anaerolineae bacterium]MCZ7551941.1 glycosyltransferase family 4 protein [Anaerolineales bacterium]OQY93946.1 MAG: glycosyltransferase WbuB [Anaerolineae bacterium UTCFX2]